MTTSHDFEQPTRIRQLGNESLELEWADGHTSAFPLGPLRHLCTCADCRVQSAKLQEQSGPFKVLGPEPSIEPSKLEQVGNYAISVTWNDGHYSTYPFRVLRSVCPCDACVALRATAAPPVDRRG